MSGLSSRHGLRSAARVGWRAPHTPARRLYSTPRETTPGRIRQALGTTVFLTATAGFIVYSYDSRSAVHKHVIMPALRSLLDAEDSHVLAVKALAGPSWLRPVDNGTNGDELKAKVRESRTSLL